MKQGPIASEKTRRELGGLQLALIATPIVLAAYALVLSIGHDSPLWEAIPGALANTIPTILFGLIAYELIRTRLMRQRLVVRFAGHLLLCAAYTLLS